MRSLGPVLSIVMPFADQSEINLALSVLVVIDMHEIKKYGLPKLFASGVRYRRETCLAPKVRETCERFLSARKLLEERYGDCDDIAAYRAAELILGGDTRARAFCRPSPVGWHCMVRRGDGRLEDPCVKLGMKVHA
jgi:hypothetical protein